MDALSETLRVVRLTGAIFINARFTAPWCYQSPSADSAAPVLEPGAERVVIFHLITEGECYVDLGDGAPVHLSAGDVAVFPQGHAHLMTSKPGLAPAKGAPLHEVLARRPRQLAYGGGGPTTRLVCGYLACDARLARMLLAGLPPLVRVNVRGSNAGIWLEASVRYALAEARSPRPGGAGVLAKLAEVLFIEVLRLYMNEQVVGRTGWLVGVGDRIVGAALNALHARPAHAWTLEELAREAGDVAVGARRTLRAARGELADAIPDAVADAARRQPVVSQQCAAGPDRRRRRLPDGHGIQPRVSPRVRRAAGRMAPHAGDARAGRLIRGGAAQPRLSAGTNPRLTGRQQVVANRREHVDQRPFVERFCAMADVARHVDRFARRQYLRASVQRILEAPRHAVADLLVGVLVLVTGGTRDELHLHQHQPALRDQDAAPNAGLRVFPDAHCHVRPPSTDDAVALNCKVVMG